MEDDATQRLLTHRGGCHCGAVTFELEAQANSKVLDCSCSICSMAGYLHLFVPRDRFHLLSGRDALVTYRFNTGVAEHYFCGTCGVKSFYIPRSRRDGYGVNARCIEPSTLGKLEVVPFDGGNWEQNADELPPLPGPDVA